MGSLPGYKASHALSPTPRALGALLVAKLRNQLLDPRRIALLVRRACTMVGERWPEVDNDSKKARSMENAQTVGLYTLRRGGRGGRYSRFDRGTSAQQSGDGQVHPNILRPQDVVDSRIEQAVRIQTFILGHWVFGRWVFRRRFSLGVGRLGGNDERLSHHVDGPQLGSGVHQASPDRSAEGCLSVLAGTDWSDQGDDDRRQHHRNRLSDLTERKEQHNIFLLISRMQRHRCPRTSTPSEADSTRLYDRHCSSKVFSMPSLN
jgi:hypothetical protein